MNKPHFLLVPYAEHGHTHPMLCLASQLASLGCSVTFIKADKAPLHQPSEEAAIHDGDDDPDDEANNHVLRRLRFVSLCVLPRFDHLKNRHEALQKTLASMEERQALLEELIADSKATRDPISCVICDFLMWKWVKDVVKRQGILVTVLATSPAIGLYSLYLLYKHRELELEKLRDRLATSRSKDDEKTRAQKLIFFKSLFEGLEESCSHVLINSFEFLEASLFEALESPAELALKFIGPLSPTWGDDVTSLGCKMARRAGSVFMEDEGCLPWLDQQPRGSVLFVSFGSEVWMEGEDVKELAMGIEASGYKFLWVVRPNHNPCGKPPAEFIERSEAEGRGMFVSWAPQRRVLEKPAVGGFLTHCGWNSTLEAITTGVPMLCFPVIADQPFNANLIHREWGVGLKVPRSAGDGRVSRAEVRKVLQVLMEADNPQSGSSLRERVAEFKEAAQVAVSSAHKVLSLFIEDITMRSIR